MLVAVTVVKNVMHIFCHKRVSVSHVVFEICKQMGTIAPALLPCAFI
jgi:hypothetical protein